MKKTKKSSKLNKNGIKMIAILTAIVIVIVIMIVITVNSNKKKKTEPVNNEYVDIADINLIDYNNLENAKVEDGIKTNTSNKVKESKKFENLTFSDVTVDSKDGRTNFNVTVTNNGKTATQEQYLEISFLNKDGETIGTAYLYFESIEVGNTTSKSAIVGDDYINMYDYSIKKAVIDNVE